MKTSAKKAIKMGHITSKLQKAKPEVVLIQGRVRKDLANLLREKLKKENVQIVEWMEACIEVYLEEQSKN
jgi:hypothetical protein